MESSPALSCIVTRCASCSTPCGINGIITLSYAEQHCTCMRCSTPCGINGIITKSVEVKLIDTHGPRLSLQQQIALSIRGLAALVVPCRVVHAEILAS